MKLNERNEVINIIDYELGRELSTEHMIDLIVWTEWDSSIFEHTTLSHLTEKQAYDKVKNNLDYYMKKHCYYYLEKGEIKGV